MTVDEGSDDHSLLGQQKERTSFTIDGLLSERPPTKKLLSQLGELLTPDFFSRRKGPPKRLGATAWLDGLRGWAALCVAFMHLTVYTHEGLELCYGQKFAQNDNHNTSIAALPILRLPFTGGHFAVMLFFVISGYVVPRRLLQILHEGRKEEFLESVHSAMIRRPVRLFMPVILSTLMFWIVWHTFGIKTPWPIQMSNALFELVNWIFDISVFLFFFKIGFLYTYYNVHTWTIPVEFRGSMFLFVFLFACHTVSTRTRVWLTFGMTLHLSLGSPGAWYACFFAGLLMSDLDLISSGTSNLVFPWDAIDKWFRARKPIRQVFLHLMLLASLYLATQPSSDWSTKDLTLGNCYGWSTLSSLIPPFYLDEFSQFRWFWLFWAAWGVVYTVREIAWVRGCFETPTAQYLGKHSFALYLVHGPMIGILGERLFYLTGVKQAWTDEQREVFGMYQNKWRDASWWPFPDGGPHGLEPNFLVCVAIALPCMLYVAEVGTRVFDNPSVKISKWVWQKWKTL